MFDNLDDSNILLYAAKCYDKPNCIDSEFEEDYKRIRYLKRLFQRYRITGNIKERLILNHLIVIQNVFGIECSNRILFSKIDPRDYSTLKTFLVYTSTMPKIIKGVKGGDIVSSEIPIDNNIVKELRKI